MILNIMQNIVISYLKEKVILEFLLSERSNI